MDSSSLQCSTSKPSNLGCKKEASKMNQSRCDEFFANYKPQNFSLPNSIMFFIAKNPTSSKLFQKLIQTCKYFFSKNPILVVPAFGYLSDGKSRLSDGKCQLFFKHRPIDLSKITSKLWITDRFYVHYAYPIEGDRTILSSVVPKLYKCDAESIHIENQIIYFQDLSLLVSSAEEICFGEVIVRNYDGANVAVEKTVQVAIKTKRIQILSETIQNINSETMKELIKLSHFLKLDEFIMDGIPEAFDLVTFYGYMKNNKTTKIYLSFADSISEAYKNRLEEIIDEILATEAFDYKPPFIGFAGINFDKRLKLDRIFSSH